MKPNSPLPAAALAIALASAGLVAFSGCAITDETAGKSKHALVCPRYKVVAVTINNPYYGGAWRADHRYGAPQTVYNNTRTGCQGAIETLFKEAS